MWADDVTVWQSRRQPATTTASGAEGHPLVHQRHHDAGYEILDRQFFDGGFVQQHVLRARRANGGSIEMRVCIVIKVGADGLITRIDEYFDPADMAPLIEEHDMTTASELIADFPDREPRGPWPATARRCTFR